MHEELVTFKTAKLAKEKGIDCVDDTLDYIKAFYSEEEGDFDEIEISRKDIVVYCYYSRPTQSLLQRWLREFHNYVINILPVDNDWYFLLTKSNETLTLNRTRIAYFKTYEQALEYGLLEALELIEIEKL